MARVRIAARRVPEVAGAAIGDAESDPREQPGVEDDVHDVRDGLQASPVPLKLARQGHPADRLRSSLDDSLKAGSVRLWRGPSHGIDDGVHLIAHIGSLVIDVSL